MSSRMLIAVTGSIAVSFVVWGCTPRIVDPKFNQRPMLELTRAPFNESTRFEYAYRMNWVGYDRDGRIDRFLYAVDPPSPTAITPDPETTWVATTRSEQLVNFSATAPDSSRPGRNGASDFHTFVVKAIDNGGHGGVLQSAPIVRSFFTYTIAPTVQILEPPPSDRAPTYTPPSVRITWTGTDEDGILDNKKPVKYKFILLRDDPQAEFPFKKARDFPDSVRIHYAPRNWAGWDSTTADTTWHQYTNLTPQSSYMFIVVAFDEAGAYSPIFSRNSNMLELRITYAASAGPPLTVWNEYFFYEWNPGVWAPNIERYIAKVEVPAGEKVEVNWSAVPGPGAAYVRGYRWALDIEDVLDPSPRLPNEQDDLRHWSEENSLQTRAEVGPFGGGEVHLFYVQAIDNNGLKSLGVIRFTSVVATLAKPLLVVDDTRFSIDTRSPGTTTCVDAPKSGTRWPNSAELDTFLYARGNFPYQCYPAGTVSKPGLFNGYPFDTVGTRTGQSVVRVPLATLGNYAHVIWITDQAAALNFKPGTYLLESISALRYMSQRGQANSLAAYIKQGGEVWMVGGGCGYATNIEFNLSTANDLTLPASSPTFSSDPAFNELVPGRFMYDLARWRSEFKCTSGPIRVVRNRARHDSSGAIPAGYARLPAEMRPHSTALGDELPPLRRSSDYFYSTFGLEYLSRQNDILEDVDPSPVVFDEQSTLDTLYSASSQVLVPPAFNRYNVCMTRYVGPAGPPVIFTGFDFWSWSRSDCQALVDAVLQDLWQLPRSVPVRATLAGSSSAAAVWAPRPASRNASPPGLRERSRSTPLDR